MLCGLVNAHILELSEESYQDVLSLVLDLKPFTRIPQT